uniref:Wax synthase domain-containing protein n=3 Tax=Corethron hystrix TaxID=216773 RepID=A0A7S1FN76_9STRA|mmetsp:Transcript_17781/g.40354  ORF Transcript_17781/g.40354 Transcript_17781/m.40354 type:complete len:327 (+) Transcript_17781:86-1066(+)
MIETTPSATSMFHRAFSQKLETDDRSPIVTFELPISGDSYGILLPNVGFWIQLIATVVVGGVFLSIISLAMHTFVVERRNTATAYLVGWGAVVPACILGPISILEFLDIRNLMLRFIIGCILPPITVYKCISTMYGTNPKEVEKSKKIFALFISSSQEIVFDPRTDEAAKATFSEVFSHLVKFLQYMMLNGIYFSWISAYEFHPFGVVAARDGYISSPSNIICLRQLANNFSIALLYQLLLTFFGEGLVAISSILTGLRFRKMMENPVFTSASPSDFWGQKWNLVIHENLKRGVYKPVRKRFSRNVAMVSSFVASGIFHEWILLGK